ncbi:MAG TPA: MarR family transcriptional regulator [Solirubrobacteraceae bacterium]|jgi:DNA-binding MarR family transcriptional regulator
MAEPADQTAGEVLEDDVDEHVRGTIERWPQIDPEVEGIVVRIGKLDRLLTKAAVTSLSRVGLTHEEFKVLIALNKGVRSHGSLSRNLMVSTGAMTNRLDKLEERGLVRRERDPSDRRGVLLEITPEGRKRLDGYIDLGADRERELLDELDPAEKRQLNGLLRRLLLRLQSEVGAAPPAQSDA